MAATSGTLVEDLPTSSCESTKPQDIQRLCLPEHLKSHIGSYDTKTPPNSPWQSVAPWGFTNKVVENQTCPSFEEVMSEQLAAQLQLAEDQSNTSGAHGHLQIGMCEYI